MCALALLATLPGRADTKVVFLSGDEEYRSEESLPMLAKIVERDFGFDTEVGFSVDQEGFVDPLEASSLTKTEELKDADLLVMFLRFRSPTPETFQNILDYLDAGKPVVAFRTSTHAFRFPNEAGLDEWGFQNDPTKRHSFGGGEKIRELLGQSWITHHGHFDDGEKPLTSITIREGKKDHPILTGVKPFQAYSWLYHVQGGGDTLAGDPELLLDGKSLKSNKEERGETDRYPLQNPVAWTKTHKGKDGAAGRVFMTTLGHPYDFRDENMRRLAVQGILWTLGKEDRIPDGGVNVQTVGEYQPNNSGNGEEKFKHGLKPGDLTSVSE